MPSRLYLVVGLLSVLLFPGCNNTLNPFCGSARPAPLIGFLSPSSIPFTDIEKGAQLTVNGRQSASSTVVPITGQPVRTSVNSSRQLQAPPTTGVIPGTGAVNASV